MQRWICTVCKYIYDPELGDPDHGVPPGTAFEDLPDDWLCPVCQLGKAVFEPYHGPKRAHKKVVKGR